MDRDETGAQESFGTVLQELMQTHARAGVGGQRWTAATLAARLGVDASLVRRWLRGERVPTARQRRGRGEQGRVDQLAQILQLSSEERERLEAAHLRALSALARGGPLPRDERAGGVARVLDDTASPLPPASLPNHLLLPLPSGSSAINDQPEVIETCIRLFAHAAKHRPPAGATIYQTYNGAGSLAEHEGRRQDWQQSLRGALEQGWDVWHLIRLDRGSSQRAIQFVDNVLSLLGTKGTYTPYYLTQYGTLAAPYGICLVSGIGAVVSFATRQTTYVDRAIYVRDPELLAVLEAHMRCLCSRPLAEPLFENYPRRTSEEERTFLEALKTMEEASVGRFLVKDGFSAITHPPSFYTDPSLAELMRARQDTFDRHVRSEPYRDVCPKRAVLRLVQEGEPARDDKGLFTGPVSPLQRRLWLENIVHLLHHYEHYELALLDEAEESVILRAEQEMPTAQKKGRESVTESDEFTEWETFGSQAILLQWRRDDPHMPHMRITEPTIVRAFESYGEMLWNRIEPVNRHKKYVVWWLEQQIAELKRQE